MHSDQYSRPDVIALTDVLEQLAGFTGNIAMAVNDADEIVGLSHNILGGFGLHAVMQLGKKWTDLARPLELLPSRSTGRRAAESQSILFCWISPLAVCRFKFATVQSETATKIILIEPVNSDDLHMSVAQATATLDNFVFPLCLSEPGTRILYSNSFVRDLLAQANETNNVQVLLDRLQPFPKRWTIQEALDHDGKFVFHSRMHSNAGFRNPEAEIHILPLRQEQGGAPWIWCILPKGLRDLVAQYMRNDTTDTVSDMLRRLVFIVQTLRDLGVDLASAQSTETHAKTNIASLSHKGEFDALSRRQSEILYMLSEGLTYDEIAARLGLKLPTVKTHVLALYKKLSVRNKAEALMVAEKNGWLMRLRHQHGR